MLITGERFSGIDKYTASAVLIGAVSEACSLARVRSQWVEVDARQSDRPVNWPWRRMIRITRLEWRTEE